MIFISTSIMSQVVLTWETEVYSLQERVPGLHNNFFLLWNLAQKGHVQPPLLDTHPHHRHSIYSNGLSPILTTSPYTSLHPSPAPRQTGTAPFQRKISLRKDRNNTYHSYLGTPPTPAVAQRSTNIAHPEGSSGHSAEVDPDSIPAPVKVEGQDWFAL